MSTERNRRRVEDIAGVLGAAFIVAGAGMIYLPAGLIVFGVMLFSGAILTARRS
ncbi:MAG: hypothetical protein J0H84_25950 [Rhizobiales bacterium]|nr:hypothetical protein [Hyphomicrobiales bacterium]